MTRKKTCYPVTERLPFDSPRAMAEYWGREALRAIRRAVTEPTYVTIEDLAMNDAVRFTRMAYWRAMQVTRYKHEP